MLKLKYLFENYDLAKRVLENWEHDSDTLDKLLSQYRISSNAIYPFSQDGRICFLRLAPTDEKLEKNIFGELEFIEYLNANSFPALKSINLKSGDAVLTISTEWGEYYASAFERVAGKQIEQTDYSCDIMYRYGKTLGKLHSLSSKFVPNIKKWTHEEVLEWTAQVICQYNAPSFMQIELEAVKSELSKLSKDISCYGLVHYDFEPDNVFYDDSTKTCSVIDFDDGMYHWFALDIEQALEALEEELSCEELQAAKNEFVNGYKSEYSYTEEMEELLPLMRRFANIYAYARLIRCVAEEFSNEPDWLVGLRKKLNNIITEMELSVEKNKHNF